MEPACLVFWQVPTNCVPAAPRPVNYIHDQPVEFRGLTSTVAVQPATAHANAHASEAVRGNPGADTAAASCPSAFGSLRSSGAATSTGRVGTGQALALNAAAAPLGIFRTKTALDAPEFGAPAARATSGAPTVFGCVPTFGGGSSFGSAACALGAGTALGSGTFATGAGIPGSGTFTVGVSEAEPGRQSLKLKCKR
jgi:hypothetical protein